MSLDARQMARLRPTAVAVHDHRDVTRQIRDGFRAQMWSWGTHLLRRRLRERRGFKNEKIKLPDQTASTSGYELALV
jgi:hypothetical protein